MTRPMDSPLLIDGSHGEGGGQILRTALTLSALFMRLVRIENIRSSRRNPGLAAQHLTCVRAAAAISRARVEGDRLGSRTLLFEPGMLPRAGSYEFDVASARPGGSAGAASLVLQTVLLPLAWASGESRVRIAGGTHMRMSPSFHYLRDIWLPLLQRCGVDASIGLEAWGWFPVGRGAIRARVRGDGAGQLTALDLSGRQQLVAIRGTAVAANLPSHIPWRMAGRARELLSDLRVPVEIEASSVDAACPGAGLFLTAEYRNLACGFSALGERGKPAEIVADEAVTALLAHHSGPGVVDVHLADQLLVPMAIANGVSRLRVERVTRHLLTNAWVVERFGLARISVEEQGGGGLVSILPQAG